MRSASEFQRNAISESAARSLTSRWSVGDSVALPRTNLRRAGLCPGRGSELTAPALPVRDRPHLPVSNQARGRLLYEGMR
jgi:hypothetical protein